MTSQSARRSLYVIGSGGFGREVVALVHAVNDNQPQWDLAGVLDDGPTDQARELLRDLGTEIVGSLADAALWTDPWWSVIAIGDPEARRRIVGMLERSAAPVRFATLVHPDTTVGSSVALGPGSVVAAGARLSTCISVGSHSHIDQNVTVGHDCTLGKFTRVNPSAAISGNVTLESGATVGANATILQGLRVGSGAFVGAGAVVVRDVAAAERVVGVPARPLA